MMPAPRLRPLLILLVATIGTAASFPPAATAQSPVTLATAEERPLFREVRLTGSVSSPQVALLSSEVAGLVKTLHVDIGDTVAQGQLLLELDDELSDIALDHASAAVLQQQEALADSRRRLAEARTLEARRSIAASDVRTLEAQERIAAAALTEAEAVVRQRRAELQRHRITAPFSGSVSRKLTEAGEWITPGSAVLELVATDGLRIDLPTPQAFYSQIDEHTELQLQFDAYPDQRYPARWDRKVPQADSQARTFLLRATLLHATLSEAADGEAVPPSLIPGMSVNALMKLGNGQHALSVPRDALLRYPDGRTSVWVAEPAGSGEATVSERFVRTGLESSDWIEIRSGLTAGANVVLQGNEILRDGQTVQIVAQEQR